MGKEIYEQKIKKWFKSTCAVCIHYEFEYYDCDYSTSGYYICNQEKPSANLTCFPFMHTPKNCKEYYPIYVINHMTDYFQLMDSMSDNDEELEIHNQIARSVLDFNERMGDYKIGSILKGF